MSRAEKELAAAVRRKNWTRARTALRTLSDLCPLHHAIVEHGPVIEQAEAREGAVLRAVSEALAAAHDPARCASVPMIKQALSSLSGIPRSERGYREAQRAIKKLKTCERQQEKAAAKALADARARRFEELKKQRHVGDTLVFSIMDAEVRKCTPLHCGRGQTRFLFLHVVVANLSSSIVHVNPLFFTLTACGIQTNVHSDSYLYDRPFPAIDLLPRNGADGWLVFGVNMSCAISLNYAGFTDVMTMEVPIPP